MPFFFFSPVPSGVFITSARLVGCKGNEMIGTERESETP